MAHSHEELLLKLLAALQHPQVLLYVHIDKKSQPLFEKLDQRGGIHLIRDRVNVQWAHISQLQAVFASYREIRNTGNAFSHFLVISGQDQPLQSMDKLLEFFHAHPGKSFLGYTPLSKEGWSGAMKRYRYHYYVRMEKLWRALMMLTGIRRRFPFGLHPFGGSQWINLARTHMDYVLDYWQQHQALVNFMETVRFPEEMLFQTLLMNSPHRGDCVNDDLRYVKWVHGKSNPEILTEKDWEEIQKTPDAFFGRKFDRDQSAALLALLENKQR